MDPEKKYYTLGVFVHDHKPSKVAMSIEEADIVRSKALQIAADKGVNVKFMRSHDIGPRKGQAALKLPLSVWNEAFKLVSQ